MGYCDMGGHLKMHFKWSTPIFLDSSLENASFSNKAGAYLMNSVTVADSLASTSHPSLKA